MTPTPITDALALAHARKRDAERATLDSNLHLARAATLASHRYGSTADIEAAMADERAALMALVAFNLRTIRMVPVTHLRLA